MHLRSARSRFQIHVADKNAPRTSECEPPLRVRWHALAQRRQPPLMWTDVLIVRGCGVAPVAFRCSCPRIEDLQSVDVHVHLSLRHRQRAFPPRRFVCPRSSAWRRSGTRRALAVGSAHPEKGVDGWGRSADRAWARPARRCLFKRSDHVCCAGIGLLLSSALPHQIAQTVRTSSMAASAALNRRPASSIVHILPYAIVTVALSRLAGPSPVAPLYPGTGPGSV